MSVRQNENEASVTKLRSLLTEATAKKLGVAEIEFAKAYGDSWSDKAVVAYLAQFVPNFLADLLKEQPDVRYRLSGMVGRNLDWMGSFYMTPAEWTASAKLFVPGYNEFDAKQVGNWLAKFSGISVLPARESSVALYVKGDGKTLQAMAEDARDGAKADEVSFEAKAGGMSGDSEYEEGDVLRLWWD